MKKHNKNRPLIFYVNNIIKKLVAEIELNQTPKLIPVTHGQIQDFVGVADFSVIDGNMNFILKIDTGLINENNIKNYKSQLYITIYHELCHLKNLEQLNNSIPISSMINSIDNYANKDSMIYNFAFMLWGEYYAYNHQFARYNQKLSEYNLLLCIQTFCNDVVKGRYMLDKTHSLHDKYIKSLQQDIYNLLYEMITVLAYKNSYHDYSMDSMINNINTFLHINVKNYIDNLSNKLHNLQTIGSDYISMEDIENLGYTIYQIYDILKFNIEFTPTLEISFDNTQPLIKFAYG